MDFNFNWDCSRSRKNVLLLFALIRARFNNGFSVIAWKCENELFELFSATSAEFFSFLDLLCSTGNVKYAVGVWTHKSSLENDEKLSAGLFAQSLILCLSFNPLCFIGRRIKNRTKISLVVCFSIKHEKCAKSKSRRKKGFA